MRRALADAGESEPDDLNPPQTRRDALKEASELGPLYAVINYLAPFVRLCALIICLFGQSEAYRQLLAVIVSAMLISMCRPPVFKLSARLAVAMGAADENSSQFHQLRLVWSQGLRCVLLLAAYALVGSAYDPRSFGLTRAAIAAGVGLNTSADEEAEPTADAPLTSAQLISLGVAVGLAWSGMWALVHRVAPREHLTLAEGTHDISSASQEEILLTMSPPLRTASLGFRMLAVALETAADVLLLFVFLPSRMEGIDPPAAARLAPPFALLPAALVYGSQHLRFRGEWLLCAGYGLLLGGMTHNLDGALLPTLVAACLFAVVRHARRTGLDVRRFHAQ